MGTAHRKKPQNGRLPTPRAAPRWDDLHPIERDVVAALLRASERHRPEPPSSHAKAVRR